MADAAIVCRGLTKRYGDVLALDALDLEVPAGSIFGFLGPNGAGKTTTLRLLTSLARRTGGSATVGGIPIGDGLANRQGLIGYLDQDPRFPGWMSGRELVQLVARLVGIPPRDVRSRADEALERVGLTDAARRHIGGYSGGMRQRLGLAQALVNQPPVLLLDEPVSALDPEGRHDMLNVIGGLRGTSTVLFSTHILTDVERICDRVAILDHGRLVADASMQDLLARYALPVYRIALEEDDPVALDRLADALRAVDGVSGVRAQRGSVSVDVDDGGANVPALLAALGRANAQVVSFERVRPSLEDVFLRIVGAGEEAA